MTRDGPETGDRIRPVRAGGFTLIELIVVIVILGILAAVALPRFIDLSREARIAKLEAARGAVGSGAALANSLSVTQGLAPNVSVNMAGATVTMAFSYPTSDQAGIATAAGLSTQDYGFSPGQPFDPPNSLVITVPGASNQAQCRFVYAQPAVQGDAPLMTNAATTGC